MISKSMDQKLPLYQRMGIRFHLMMCALCRRYKQQLLFIRSVLHRNNETKEKDCQSLPADARKRIEKKLTDEIKQKPNKHQ